jgi:hypothetical protein
LFGGNGLAEESRQHQAAQAKPAKGQKITSIHGKSPRLREEDEAGRFFVSACGVSNDFRHGFGVAETNEVLK